MPQIEIRTADLLTVLTVASGDRFPVMDVSGSGSTSGKAMTWSELSGAFAPAASTRHDNTVHVDAAFGSDATGARERADLPFATPQAAAAAAVAGDLVVVRPGSYTTTGTLAKNGVNWRGEPGANLAYNGTDLSVGVFDDGGSACSYSVDWLGTITRDNTAGDTDTPFTLLNVSHASSTVYFRAKRLQGSWGSDNYAALIKHSAGSLTWDVAEIVGATTPTGGGYCVWWAGGTMYGRYVKIDGGTDGSIVGVQCGVDSGGVEGYVVGQEIATPYPVITGGSDTTSRFWVVCPVIKRTGTASNYAVDMSGSNRPYILSQKLTGGVRRLSGDGPSYVRADKVEAVANGATGEASLLHWDGTAPLHVQVSHWEGLAYNNDLIRLNGGTVNLNGGVVTGTGTSLLTRIAGATAYLSGMRIEAGNVSRSSGTLVLSDVAITGDLSGTVTKRGFVVVSGTDSSTATWQGEPAEIIVPCSDETTALTAGTAKFTFRMPFAMTVTGVKASVNVAPTGTGNLTVDINESGTSILSTKLTFDASEKTTATAATPAVISDPSLASDAEVSVDIDAVSGTVTGAGLKVTLSGVRTS